MNTAYISLFSIELVYHKQRRLRPIHDNEIKSILTMNRKGSHASFFNEPSSFLGHLFSSPCYASKSDLCHPQLPLPSFISDTRRSTITSLTFAGPYWFNNLWGKFLSFFMSLLCLFNKLADRHHLSTVSLISDWAVYFLGTLLNELALSQGPALPCWPIYMPLISWVTDHYQGCGRDQLKKILWSFCGISSGKGDGRNDFRLRSWW